MKRIAAFFLLSLIILCACQPTPESEVVTPKDFDALIEKAQASPVPVEITLTPDASPAVVAGKGLFQMDFYGNTEAFHVVVDAEVVRPEGPFPILEVSPGDFDEQNAQPFFDVLTEGFTLYTAEELETKQSLEKEILELQQFIDDELPGFNGTAKQKKEEIKYWKGELDELKQRYLTARDEPGTPARKVKLTWSEPAKYSTQTAGSFYVQSADRKQVFRVQTNALGTHGKHTFDNKNAFVSFYNDAVIPEGVIHAFEQTDPIEDMDAIPVGSGLTATPREAQRRAKALTEGLGFSDFAVSNIHLVHAPLEADGRTGIPCYLYTVSFVRLVNGVPVIRPTYYSSSGDEAEPRPAWTYERLTVTLRDTDLYAFTYGGPLVLGKTLAESASLMSFDAVMKRFDQMVEIQYEPMLNDPRWDNIQSIEVQVDKIVLSLQRVAQPDNIDGGLLVPTWNFFGSILCTTPKDTFNHMYNPSLPFMTLNAVDGNLIDPLKGY